jgi:nucleotide-binding universal stress UspA family protein
MTATNQPAARAVADRVVVGIDGSDSAKVALRWALFQAAVLHAEVEAVAAWSSPTAFAVDGWPVIPTDWQPGEVAAAMLAEVVAEVAGDHPAIAVHQSVREGGAARVLLAASAGARLLVVGSRGRGGFTGLLLGSVSSACAQHASCPVLVVHGDTAPAPTVSTASSAASPG